MRFLGCGWARPPPPELAIRSPAPYYSKKYTNDVTFFQSTPHPLLNFPETYKANPTETPPGTLLRFPELAYIIFVGSGVSDLIVRGGLADLGSLAGTCTLRCP
jgi:hypothetical protein